MAVAGQWQCPAPARRVSNRVSGKVSGKPPGGGGVKIRPGERMSGNPLGRPFGAPLKRVKKEFSTLAAWILGAGRPSGAPR